MDKGAVIPHQAEISLCFHLPGKVLKECLGRQHLPVVKPKDYLVPQLNFPFCRIKSRKCNSRIRPYHISSRLCPPVPYDRLGNAAYCQMEVKFLILYLLQKFQRNFVEHPREQGFPHYNPTMFCKCGCIPCQVSRMDLFLYFLGIQTAGNK